MTALDNSAGVAFVRLAGSDAARDAGDPHITPTHLLIGICELCDDDLDLSDPDSDDPDDRDVDAALRSEATDLRRRFAIAQVDPAALRRRIRRRIDAMPHDHGERDVLSRSPASRAAFARAENLARVDGRAEFGAPDLLRAVLEKPVPQWAVPAADLGMEDLLGACFPPVPAGASPPGDAGRVEIEVLDGTAAGRALVASGPGLWLVGRSTDCHLSLAGTADKVISRYHAVIEFNPPRVLLRDLGSRNGTAVNDVVVTAPARRDEKRTAPEHELHDGDVISMGDTTFRLRIIPPAAPTRPGRAAAPVSAKDGGRPPTGRPRDCPVCADPATGPDGELCTACGTDPVHMVARLEAAIDDGRPPSGLFGGYTVLDRLGRGGMGTVYLARDEQTEGMVGLKITLPAGDRHDVEQLFRREAANAKGLAHRHINRQREHGRWAGVYYLVVDYCEGGNLFEVMARNGGPLPPRRAVRIAQQVLDALDHAHHAAVLARRDDGRIVEATGLVHRDISPGNVLFAGGTVRLADFGLSKAFELAGRSGVTGTDVAAGKPRYMPRAQLQDYLHAGPEVDVWAAAAVLYYMLTEQVPRDFPEHVDEFVSVLVQPARPIRERDRAVPTALADVIDRALDEETPGSGYDTARALRDALDEVCPTGSLPHEKGTS